MSQKIADVNHYGLNSQGAGLLPLLLPMFLNNFYTYIVSYQITIGFCVLSLILFAGLLRGRIYQFMFLPTMVTLGLYSIFMITRLKPVLYVHSSLILEWLFVAVMAVLNMFKRQAFLWLRWAGYASATRKHLQASLTEYFWVAQVTQNLYTLHLFILVFYTILPDDHKNLTIERLIYTDAPLLIGIVIIIFEVIRVFLIRRNLQKEKWLPVLDGNGKVIGRVPYSVSMNSQIKRCHPIVRIAIIYKGMFYLTKHGADDPVSPDAFDYPSYGYVLYKQPVEEAVKGIIGTAVSKTPLKPRMQTWYLFESENAKNYVSLYVMVVRTKELFEKYIKNKTNGKLWTQKQIEENLGKGIFSEYFEKEYSYLQSTVLLAEEYYGQVKGKNKSSVEAG